MTKPIRQSYSLDFKLALVERFLADETAPDLAAEVNLPSPLLLKTWVRAYRRDGADALRPKPKGRPRKPETAPPAETSGLERLRRDNDRLRAEVGLVCRVRQRKRYNSYQGEQGTAGPNLLNGDFDATAPNQKWATDVTEFSAGDRKLYFSPVMDLFDRQIIFHTIGTSPNLDQTNTSLREALACLQPGQPPLVHSDQMFHRVRLNNTDTLAAHRNEYIRWYNTERISTKLKGLSPVQYRAQALAA